MADGKKTKKGPKGVDVTIRIFDNYTRTMEGLKKSLSVINEKYKEQDKVVNFGVGYVEDKKLTHGISMGAVNYGVKIYGETDLQFNSIAQEYLMMSKYGDIQRYSWAGSKLASVAPVKRFTKLIYMPPFPKGVKKPGESKEKEKTGYYIGYTPGKYGFHIMKDDFTMVMDTVSISPISKIIYGDRKLKDETQYEFFIISQAALNKYGYHPVNNVVSLQDAIKISDVEAEKAEIEQVCFDQPPESNITRKQWIYLTFKQHCTIIDVTGRFHGTKKNLHAHTITAIVAPGAGEFIVTGDEKGILKMWGQRWTFLTQIQPHGARVTHLIEHPNGRAAVSISRDQTMFAWSFDSQLKMESMKSPEIVEWVAMNKEKKSFMVNGPRKLILWRMEVLFSLHTQLMAPLSIVELVWNPDYPFRAIVASTDNAVRLINPATGTIITTALIFPISPPLESFIYLPQSDLLLALVNVGNSGALEIQHFDTTQNPCKLKSVWKDTMWDTAITAIALYDYIPSLVCAEIGMTFSTKKHVEFTGTATFIIAGRRDGGLAKVNIDTGEMDYFTPCHKGYVSQIKISPETSQFASLGVDPSIRLWKISINQDHLFVPLVDISWNYPIRHVALIREVIGFALSRHDSTSHKVVIFNTLETQRYDHRSHFAHEKEILSFSGSRELMIFCTSSMDETVRIWSDKNDLVRVICLNWVPCYAAFGTRQGDIFLGIADAIHLIPADKYLSVIYRNRVMMSPNMNIGPIEASVPVNLMKASQDNRMHTIEEEKMDEKVSAKDDEEDKDDKEIEDKTKKFHIVPTVQHFQEPQDSQRAKDFENLRLLEDDIKLIVEGNHPISKSVPDARTMTKKQWDDFGKSVFPNDADDHKFFISESRLACLLKMEESSKDLTDYAAVQ